MDNNQFHIPSSEYAHSPESIQYSESTFDISEKSESLSYFDHVKIVERYIDTYRSAATEANLPMKTRVEKARETVTNLFTTNTVPRSLHDRLVEVESVIGGNILPAGKSVLSQRFWYQENEWFYEVHDAVGPMVARYQFVNESITKLVDGKPVNLAQGEADTIYKTIALYYDAVSELYISKEDLRLAA